MRARADILVTFFDTIPVVSLAFTTQERGLFDAAKDLGVGMWVARTQHFVKVEGALVARRDIGQSFGYGPLGLVEHLLSPCAGIPVGWRSSSYDLPVLCASAHQLRDNPERLDNAERLLDMLYSRSVDLSEVMAENIGDWRGCCTLRQLRDGLNSLGDGPGLPGPLDNDGKPLDEAVLPDRLAGGEPVLVRTALEAEVATIAEAMWIGFNRRSLPSVGARLGVAGTDGFRVGSSPYTHLWPTPGLWDRMVSIYAERGQ